MLSFHSISIRCTLPTFLASLAFFFSMVIAADSPPKDSPLKAADNEYIRIVRNEKNIVTSLDTAVVRYESTRKKQKGQTVDLIGAIHIADKAYYDKINALFDEYDLVLYELVTDEPKVIPSPEEMKAISKDSRNPIGLLQDGMADILGLEHQLYHIDYTKKNMVHADMSGSLFYQRMIEEGELGNIIARAIKQALTQEDKSAKMQGRFFAVLFAKDKALALKRAAAQEIANEMESQLFILEGDEGSTLISERNAVALKKVRNQLRKGTKKIAIFYGAAHLYDFDKRLREDFKMVPTETRWIKAWNLESANNDK